MKDDRPDEGEQQWLYSISKSPLFDFLNEPKEDIYSLNDGEPVNDILPEKESSLYQGTGLQSILLLSSTG